MEECMGCLLDEKTMRKAAAFSGQGFEEKNNP
jgi:hypothetical protein